MPLLRSIQIKETQNSDSYPFNLPVIRTLENLDFSSSVSFFVGENGCGKSTLMRAIAFAANVRVIGQDQKPKNQTVFNPQSLASTLKLIWSKKTRNGFLMSAESFYSYIEDLHRIKRDAQLELEKINEEYTGRSVLSKNLASMPHIRSLHELKRDYGEGLETVSHGEGFLTFFERRFHGEGLYLLDEPEAPLSPIRQLSFLVLIHTMVQQGAQFIIATHSPILMTYPGAVILNFDSGTIQEESWDSLEHVQLTRDILTNPNAIFNNLFK